MDDGVEELDAAAAEDASAPVELPAPPGLDDHLAPLRAFVDFFEIDPERIAQATASPRLERSEDRAEQRVAQLPNAERTAWLMRLARGEPHLDLQLLRRLREVGQR